MFTLGTTRARAAPKVKYSTKFHVKSNLEPIDSTPTRGMNMQFCPECENVLLVKKKKVKVAAKGKKKTPTEELQKFLYCASCGYEAPFEEENKRSYLLSVKIEHSEKDKTMVLEEPTQGLKISEEDREAQEDYFEDEFYTAD